MTRRQIYFYNKKNNTYYVSEEFNGDKWEMEAMRGIFGGIDSCDKNWNEILDDLKGVDTLSEFLQAIAKVTRYYHSGLPGALPGTRFHVYHSKDEIECKDETYAIFSDQDGIILDKTLSFCVEDEK